MSNGPTTIISEANGGRGLPHSMAPFGNRGTPHTMTPYANRSTVLHLVKEKLGRVVK